MIIHQDHRHLRRLGPTLVLAIVGLAIAACGEQSGADSGAETSTPNSAEAAPGRNPSTDRQRDHRQYRHRRLNRDTRARPPHRNERSREDQPSGQQVDEFARRVNEMSDGTIQIEPVFHAGDGGLDFDQRVIDRITSSDLDMGLIPTRAWDTEGVDSLRALNTPFLITSEAAVADVITSGIANDMMSGLDQAGVVGLALMPEALRHPYSFGDPLLAPADYDGAIVRTPISATVTEMFSALGATTTAEEPDINTQTGMESEYALQPTGTATGNVTFFPKVNSLVVNGRDSRASRPNNGPSCKTQPTTPAAGRSTACPPMPSWRRPTASKAQPLFWPATRTSPWPSERRRTDDRRTRTGSRNGTPHR